MHEGQEVCFHFAWLQSIAHANTETSMLPKTIQTLLFSATFPEKVLQYANKFAPNAHSLKLQRSDLTVKGISQMFIDCPNDSTKYDILCRLYGLMTIGQSVIFVKVLSRMGPFYTSKRLC